MTSFGTTRLVLLATALTILDAPAEWLLTEHALSTYVIMVAKDADDETIRAASEIRNYVHQSTGAELPILSELPAGRQALWVGWSPEVAKALHTTAAAMRHDQIIIRSLDDGTLIVTGHPQNGVLFAAYQFLEHVIGIRWWSAEETTVPTVTRLVMQPLSIDYTPKTATRLPYAAQFFEATSTFCTKLRCHGPRQPDRGHNQRPLFFLSHSSSRLLPDQSFFNDNRNLYAPDAEFAGSEPEYYALRDGRRLGALSQPCLSNPAVLEQMVANIKEAVRRLQPDCRVIWLTQNDNTEVCECPRCLAALKQLGNRADLNIDFVNQIADALQNDFPGIAVETFAYQFTLEPPKTVRPSDHVRVRVCLIEASSAHPLTHPLNRTYYDALRGWCRIAKHINVWHYTTNFTNIGLAHPNTAALAEDIRLISQLGVREIFTQDSADGGAAGWFPIFRANLIAHCLWDPTLDYSHFTTDFFRGYYGAAGTPLQRLLELYQQAAGNSPFPMPCYMMDTARWLTLDTLRQGDALIAAAETAVADDPILARRVALIRFMQEWTTLWRAENSCLRKATAATAPLRSSADLARAWRDLPARLALIPRTPTWKHLYTREGMNATSHLKMLQNFLTPEPEHTALPIALQSVPAADLIILPRETYQIDEDCRIDDYKAPVPNSSVRLRLADHEWKLRVNLPAIADADTWQLLAELRIPDAVTNPAGTALVAGLYSHGTNYAEKTALRIQAESLSHTDYRLIPLDRVDFHRDFQLYFAGTDNATVPELILGRVFLRRLHP